MKWTEEKISTFWALKEQGLNLREIADELGCSYSATQNKMHELMKRRNGKMADTPTAAPVTPTAPVTEATEVTETPTATVETPTKAPRETILDTAKSIITGEREKQYGHPEDNFKIIAEFWKTYLENRCVSSNGSVALYPEDVAVMMSFLKIARIMSGNYKEDNFVDACGYLAIAGEMMK